MRTDLKYHVMAKLGRIGNLGTPLPSADAGVLATAVHAEVPWFDENDQLMLRPDITVTDPGELSIQRAMQCGIPLPRKGCHFIGNSVVLELKFYKGRDGVRPRALPAIQSDIDKIERLTARGSRLSPETFLHGVAAGEGLRGSSGGRRPRMVNEHVGNVRPPATTADSALSVCVVTPRACARVAPPGPPLIVALDTPETAEVGFQWWLAYISGTKPRAKR